MLYVQFEVFTSAGDIVEGMPNLLVSHDLNHSPFPKFYTSLLLEGPRWNCVANLKSLSLMVLEMQSRMCPVGPHGYCVSKWWMQATDSSVVFTCPLVTISHQSMQWHSFTAVICCSIFRCAVQTHWHRQTIFQLCCACNLELSACCCHQLWHSLFI